MELLKALGIIAGGVVAIARYFIYLEKRESERSVGSTKIKGLEDEIKDVKHTIEDNGRMLAKLSTDYSGLIHRMWEYMAKK
ncbi:MAG: hypothetical protein WKF88_09265 [Ferruginibacter sp.]